MGNKTNMQQWAGQERLRFIEAAAYWRGFVQRQDVTGVFGVSAAQASGDFQGYIEMNPGALVYNLNKKRYEGAEAMGLLWDKGTLGDAMRRFLGVDVPTGLGRWNDDGGAGTKVAGVVLPMREPTAAVERAVFQAVVGGLRVRVRYLSIHGSSDRWRWLRPHAFGHNGSRWHTRAWCEESGAYKDFVLARIAEVEWPVAVDRWSDVLRPDVEWESFVTLVLTPADELDAEQRAAVLLEYGMAGGEVAVTCRKAMEYYFRDKIAKSQRLQVSPAQE